MGVFLVVGLLILSVKHSYGQLSTPVNDAEAGSPFGGPSARTGFGNSPLSGGMGSGQQSEPVMMMADPRMTGMAGAGAMRLGGMQGGRFGQMNPAAMYPGQLNGGYPMSAMQMNDPRMSGIMAGGGGAGMQSGFGGMNPALFRGQLGGGGGFPLQHGGFPMQFQGGPMGDGSPFGGQLGQGSFNPYAGMGGPMSGMGGGMAGMGGGMFPGVGGSDDGQIITAGNGMPSMGAGPGGVSFFPFARVRPGPGLVIVDNSNPNPFDIAPSNATDADESSNATLTEVPVAATGEDDFIVGLPTVASSTTAVPTVTTGRTITNGTTTTATPCPHPVYMNRVFMTTALKMGLISANTSCVVLIDH